MTFITSTYARNESRARWATRAVAENEIKKSASIDTIFDVFISHSYEDAEVIAGIKLILEKNGLSSYVDWIEDVQMDRNQVSAATAEQLRKRLSNCRFLLFATSKTSPSSRWMPWELGYFDGLKNGRVGILPIVEDADDTFRGQEYLGLYPAYEEIGFVGYGRKLGRRTGPGQGELLRADVHQ